MAYTKTVWVTGDTITAAKLNNAEDGIEAANELIYKIPAEFNDEDDMVLSKKYSEISAAFLSGKLCVIVLQVDDALYANIPVLNVSESSGSYKVQCVWNGVSTPENLILATDSADGYPVEQ